MCTAVLYTDLPQLVLMSSRCPQVQSVTLKRDDPKYLDQTKCAALHTPTATRDPSATCRAGYCKEAIYSDETWNPRRLAALFLPPCRGAVPAVRSVVPLPVLLLWPLPPGLFSRPQGGPRGRDGHPAPPASAPTDRAAPGPPPGSQARLTRPANCGPLAPQADQGGGRRRDAQVVAEGLVLRQVRRRRPSLTSSSPSRSPAARGGKCQAEMWPFGRPLFSVPPLRPGALRRLRESGGSDLRAGPVPLGADAARAAGCSARPAARPREQP